MTMANVQDGLQEIVDNAVSMDRYKDRAEYINEKAGVFESLGFDKLASSLNKKSVEAEQLNKVSKENYVVIKDNNIAKFLKSRTERYNSEEAINGRAMQIKRDHPDYDYVQGYFKSNKKKRDFIFGTYSSKVHKYNRQKYISNIGLVSASGTLQGDADKKLNLETQSLMVCQTNDYDSSRESTIGQFTWKETPIQGYNKVPPQGALDALATDQAKGIMDEYAIGEVEGVPDPILFGRINGCEDRFYIASWGDDVTLDDLI